MKTVYRVRYVSGGVSYVTHVLKINQRFFDIYTKIAQLKDATIVEEELVADEYCNSISHSTKIAMKSSSSGYILREFRTEFNI